MLLNNLIKNLKKCMPFVEISLFKNEIVGIVNQKFVPIFMYFLKKHENYKFNCLMDICGVDYPEVTKKRYEIVYQLLSHTYNQRFRIKTYTSEHKAIYSVYSIYINSSWYEREVWDMIGVWVYGTPDLRKILTDYGFSNHPLRKDFPVIGFYEVEYSDFEKVIKPLPLEISQTQNKF
jgi:NADH dehydrogenase (ubiquinone) Fe-S protein 3